MEGKGGGSHHAPTGNADAQRSQLTCPSAAASHCRGVPSAAAASCSEPRLPSLSPALRTPQILCSADVWAKASQGEGRRLRSIDAVNLGLFTLKGVADKMQVYQIRYPPYIPLLPSLLTIWLSGQVPPCGPLVLPPFLPSNMAAISG